MNNDTLIAVDLAKSVFEVAISQQPGKVHERRRLARRQVLPFFVHHPCPSPVLHPLCT